MSMAEVKPYLPGSAVSRGNTGGGIPKKGILVISNQASGRIYESKIGLGGSIYKSKTTKRVQFIGIPEYNAADEEAKINFNRKKYK